MLRDTVSTVSTVRLPARFAVEGRKRTAATVVCDAAGEPLAWAETVWILLDPVHPAADPERLVR